MLIEANKYADNMSQLEWVYLGQLLIASVKEGVGDKRVAVLLSRKLVRLRELLNRKLDRIYRRTRGPEVEASSGIL